MPSTYFTVSEVCRRLNLKPHVLRYWEKEFELKVRRNSAGRRIYSEIQIERLKLIKRLVHTERLTVKGARRKLSHMRSELPPVRSEQDLRRTLLWMKKELVSVRSLLGPD